MYRNKPFEAKLLKRYDPPARIYARSVMTKYFGATFIRENESEDSGVEGYWDQLYRLLDGKEMAVEAEIKDPSGKKGWWGQRHVELDINHPFPFQFGSVDIPYRKLKNKAGLYLVISGCYKHVIVVKKTTMLEYGAINKNCEAEMQADGSKAKRTEPYFRVPLSKTIFLSKDMTTGKWKRIRRV